MEQIVQLNAKAKLSEHFSLGEMTKSNTHPEVYNIPSHEAIDNMKRVCEWLEVLRERYNDKYVIKPLLVISTKRSAWRDLINWRFAPKRPRPQRFLDYARNDRWG